MITHDIYLIYNKEEKYVGYDPVLEAEIKDTLQRIEDGTYEYVGEIRPRVKLSYLEEQANYGW